MPITIYKNSNGEKVPSVTTVLSVIEKPALKFWANKIGLEGVKVTEYVDDKAMIGTLTHHIIESHINKTDQNFSKFNCNDEQIEQAHQCTKKYLEWENYQAEFIPLATELKLVSEKFGYGGTIDLLAVLNGKITLIDFKTCNAIYDEPYYQTAAYAELADENKITDKKIEQIVILRIGRNESEGFEYIEHKTRKASFKVFLSALELFKAKKEFQEAQKTNGRKN